ncbi:hypothetical protein [Actinomadura litoris]|uniref:Uncharacterized protein n=1 Tax=Actinomadura litoris TaxID=2678616 RepID=A0A7K1L7J2_9ACTN|nr:hypothetical protein [Actinomadura litoris]MUN40412.1 hypothetical protein [Actinomadura litoris]
MANEQGSGGAAAGVPRIDPAELNRRLNADVAEVEALGRTGARIDPTAGDIPDQVRAHAARIGFESPVDAAAQALRHIAELPAGERGTGSPLAPYHAAAGRTIAEGEVVAHSGRRVVFHRAAPVAAGVTVRLEASVRVTAGGPVWLDSFGWPAVETAVPVHAFAGTRADHLAEAITELSADGPFDQAMLMVFATALGEPGDGDDVRRRELARLVADRPGRLAAYVSQAETYAESVRANGPYGACLHRSALESLFENYLGSAAFALVDQEDVDDLDEVLREEIPEADSLAPETIPVGTPVHHWWWNLAVRV